MRALPALLLLAACAHSAPKRPSEPTPEQVFEVRSPGLEKISLRVEPGQHVVRFHATCTGLLGGGATTQCSRAMFAAVLVFAGDARPPLLLHLMHEGQQVDLNAPPSRCAEKDVGSTAPWCTMYSSWGWDDLDGRPASEPRTFDLVIENAGPALEGTLSVWLGDPQD